MPNTAGLPESEAALVISSLAQIVGKFHEMGIVHRDLKPPNILLTSRSLPYEVRVADFGLSARISRHKTKLRTRKKKKKLKGSVGTPKYLAPEVVRGGRYDKAVDVWGLGLILYEMVSGKLAFQDLDSDFVTERLGWVDFPALMLDLEGLGEEVKDLILKMLSLDPKMRLSCEEIREHPWVVRNTSGEEFVPRTPRGYQQLELEEEMEVEARENVPENQRFAPKTPIPVLRLKRLNGVWVPERRFQQQQEEIQKLALEIEQQLEEIQNPGLEPRIEHQQQEGIQKLVLEQEEMQKRDLKRKNEDESVELRSRKKLRLKCVNGFWQVAKPCSTTAIAV